MKHSVWLLLALTVSSYSQTPGNGVTDVDGNFYNSVIIGTQEWMKENLNVSKYTDGTPIPQVTDPTLFGTQWAALSTGAWCNYNNNLSNGNIYGKLYNWNAVMGIYDNSSLTNTNLRKQACPAGWHIPTIDEWAILINYLDPNANGGSAYPNLAGGKMKEAGLDHWQNPNTGADNSSNFTGLPGGYRSLASESSFDGMFQNAIWWSSTEDFSPGYVYSISLQSNIRTVQKPQTQKKYGESCRCIKGNPLNNQLIKIKPFNIYPNPAKEQITIDLSNTTNINVWRYKIVNTLGQEVLKGVLSYQQNIVQLNNIKGQGVYFVKIYDSSNKLMDTKKIIIQQ